MSDNLKERIKELTEKRDRTGKDPLTTKERLSLLNEIYDGLLYLWKQTVLAGSAKGSLAIHYQLERARLEMVDLKRTASVISGEPIDSSAVSFNLPKYEPELHN